MHICDYLYCCVYLFFFIYYFRRVICIIKERKTEIVVLVDIISRYMMSKNNSLSILLISYLKNAVVKNTKLWFVIYLCFSCMSILFNFIFILFSLRFVYNRYRCFNTVTTVFATISE
jgi:hypothetical protein